ncbi:hypothetical protein N0V90_011718 [Kalmusia sp. IMI 367209]|nr:hypothetical protein N0V90_011718 [Kalmusia sp. IMI 367209]
MHDAPPVTPVRARPTSHTNFSASTQTTSSDPAFSLLLSLPRELRDRIYSYALVSQFPFWWPSPTTPKHNVALGLLSASRQVHSEATPILYSLNKFLFTNPSDCTMFRIVASPLSENITSVYLRIREKDVKPWAKYLGSKDPSWSMKYDLPKLKSLWIFLRCGTMGTPGMINGLAGGNIPAFLAVPAQAIQFALPPQLAQQVQINVQTQLLLQLQQQQQQPQAAVAGQTNVNAQAPMPFVQFAQGGFQNQNGAVPHPHLLQNNPPANQSPLATLAAQHGHQQHAPHVHGHAPVHHQHGIFATLMRWQREMGLENLCLSLQETRPADADVKMVCIVKLPRAEVQRLVRIYADELTLDKNGDARTRFRRVHGVDVSLEVSGYEIGI